MPGILGEKLFCNGITKWLWLNMTVSTKHHSMMKLWADCKSSMVGAGLHHTTHTFYHVARWYPSGCRLVMQ